MALGLLAQGATLYASINSGAQALTFDDVGKTITRAAGDFTADGFQVGDLVETDAAGNPGPFTVNTATALVLTVDEAVAAEGPVTATATTYVVVEEARDFAAFDGENAEITMTHLRSTAQEFRLGLPDNGNLTADMNYVETDRGQDILLAMRTDRTQRAFRLEVPPAAGLGGVRWTFLGLVKALPISMSVDDKITQNLSLRLTGSVARILLAAA